MIFRTVLMSLLGLVTATASHAGFIGGGHLFTDTETFDMQEEGARVDFGTNINSGLDLEWGYVEFGKSTFNRPDYKEGNTVDFDSNNDDESFKNIGFGRITSSSSEGGKTYRGINSILTNGLSAGFKLNLRANDWLTLYGRASFLAWKAETTLIEMYAERNPLNDSGDTVAPEDATNLNPCGTLGGEGQRCEIVSDGKDHWAVDFWYGYGVLLQPYSWMAIRTEYSIVTLNAVDFPKSVLEGFSTSLEVHF
jgi:opacity protein-like surface antigen